MYMLTSGHFSFHAAGSSGPCNVDCPLEGYPHTSVFQITLEFSCSAAAVHFQFQPQNRASAHMYQDWSVSFSVCWS